MIRVWAPVALRTLLRHSPLISQLKRPRKVLGGFVKENVIGKRETSPRHIPTPIHIGVWICSLGLHRRQIHKPVGPSLFQPPQCPLFQWSEIQKEGHSISSAMFPYSWFLHLSLFCCHGFNDNIFWSWFSLLHLLPVLLPHLHSLSPQKTGKQTNQNNKQTNKNKTPTRERKSVRNTYTDI